MASQLMNQLTFVSDIYQWIIDDVVTKIRQEFIRYEVNESVLFELAEKWENSLIHAKICEVPDLNDVTCTPNQFIAKDSRTKTLSDMGVNRILAPLDRQLRLYQNAVGLLYSQFVKIPKINCGGQDYFFFLCQQYTMAVEDLQNQIRGINSMDSTKNFDLSPFSMVEEDKKFKHELDRPNVGRTENEELLKSRNYGDINRSRQNSLIKNSSISKKCSVGEHSEGRTRLRTDLDHEELSDLSISDTEDSISDSPT